MDDTSSPLEPHQLDELLSAELDGELDAAARDLGLSPDEASARLRATPGVSERRTALATARGLLAQPPDLDELAAARLRGAALAAVESDASGRSANRSRRWQVFLGAGVAAASVAALVALVAGLGGQSTAKSSSASRPVEGAAAAPATTGPETASLPTAALGQFAQYSSLALAAVDHDAANPSALKATTTPGPSGSAFAPSAADVPTATTTPTPTGDQVQKNARNSTSSGGTHTSPDATSASTCATPRPVPAGTAPVLRATATLAGKPVIVFVFAGRDEHVVVIEDIHCVVLNYQMLR